MNHPRLARVLSACVFWGSWPISYLRLTRAERSRVLVIANGTHLLLLKSWHAPYKWTLPGGGIRGDETAVLSAARELDEETKLELGTDLFRDIGRAAFHDRGLRFRCHYFLVELPEQAHVQSHPPEVLEVMWLPIAEVDNGMIIVGADVLQAISMWRKMLQ